MPPKPHRAIQTRLPGWYRGHVHAALHFATLGGATGAAAAALAVEQPWLLGSVAVLVPGWSVVEYFIHRKLLHGTSLWAALARDHGTHHVYFPADDMFVSSHLDMYRVLLRPQDVLAVELFVASVAGAASYLGLGPALAIFTSANLYLLLYEVAHAASHTRAMASHPWLRASSRHHRAHHQQVASANRNYANVFPWLDTLFGTTRPRRGTP